MSYLPFVQVYVCIKLLSLLAQAGNPAGPTTGISRTRIATNHTFPLIVNSNHLPWSLLLGRSLLLRSPV